MEFIFLRRHCTNIIGLKPVGQYWTTTNRIRDQDSHRMTSEQIIRRSDILNTKVITDDNAKQLGVVSQLWVDIDRREVVAPVCETT